MYHARFLGEGGFTKDVALKVLNEELEGVDEIASRLRDEARILGLLRHRAIVQVDRLTKLDGRWTVVMEYVEGVDLHEAICARAVPIRPALEIASEVAGALHAAHNGRRHDGAPLRLLHRDIKPANIRVTPFGEVKVLDFGIARAEFNSREAITRNMAFGSLEYMAPERLDFIDHSASDVYALGAVVFECLTGEMFGKTRATRRRHEKLLAQRIRQLRASDIGDGRVIQLVFDMMRWDPEARPLPRDVTRRCDELVRGMDGQSLRDWAEDVIPGLLEQGDVPRVDDRVSSILIEREEPAPKRGAPAANTFDVGLDSVAKPSPESKFTALEDEPTVRARSSEVIRAVMGGEYDSAFSAPKPVKAPEPPGTVAMPPPRTSKAPRPPAPSTAASVTDLLEPGTGWLEDEPTSILHRRLAVLSFVAVSSLLVAFIYWGTQPADEPAGAANGEFESNAVADATPELEEHSDPSPPPVSPAPGAEATSNAKEGDTPALEKPTPSPTAAPPASKPKQTTRAISPPRPPTGAQVDFTGEATRIELRSGDKRYVLPARVPAGTYRVHVKFETGDQVELGAVDVPSSGEMTLKCDAMFMNCTPI